MCDCRLMMLEVFAFIALTHLQSNILYREVEAPSRNTHLLAEARVTNWSRFGVFVAGGP